MLSNKWGAVQTTGTLLILDVVCAMCWIIAFIVAAKRYRAGKDED